MSRHGADAPRTAYVPPRRNLPPLPGQSISPGADRYPNSAAPLQSPGSYQQPLVDYGVGRSTGPAFVSGKPKGRVQKRAAKEAAARARQQAKLQAKQQRAARKAKTSKTPRGKADPAAVAAAAVIGQEQAAEWQAAANRERRGGRSGQVGRKWVATIFVCLAAFVLIIRGLRPVNRTTLIESSGNTPADSLAAAFVTDWFTWDAADPTARDTRLAAYSSTFAQNVGWNGAGKQTVAHAETITSTSDGAGDYVELVRATFTDPTRAPLWVQVKVYDSHGTYAVMSAPAPVSAPPVAIPPGESAPDQEQDSTIVTPIEAALDVFFPAWASNDPVLPSLIVEDSGITSLNGTVTYVDSIDTVLAGTVPDARDALADVTWKYPDGSQATTTYKVSLKLIGGHWMVDAVAGGVTDDNVVPKNSAAPTPSASASEPAEDDTSGD